MVFDKIKKHLAKYAMICFCIFTVAAVSIGAVRIVLKVSADREILRALNSNPENDKIVVHIKGAVVSEGVYSLQRGSRIQDAVLSAGGFSPDAAGSSINLAERVCDGDEIIIPSSSSPAINPDGKVNLNTATHKELTSLPGIGDVTAKKIISYRETHGAFTNTEQLKDIKGLGGKNYENIKNLVTIE